MAASSSNAGRPSWAALTGWSPGPIEAAATDLKSSLDDLRRQSDHLTSVRTEQAWFGQAATAAKKRESTLRDRLEQEAADLAAARTALDEGADRVGRLQHLVKNIESYAQAKELAIDASGGVRDARTHHPTFINPHDAREYTVDRESFVKECRRLVEEALTEAAQADAALSTRLKAISDGKTTDGGATSLQNAIDYGTKHGGLDPSAPPANSTNVQANKAWWTSLTGSQRERVIEEHPDWIGNRDGVDFTSRDQANRNRLPTLMQQARAELKAAQKVIDDEAIGPGSPGETALHRLETRQARERLARAKDKVDALDTLQAIKNLPSEREKRILGIDMTHERAQAIVANGDVDHAKHVAVFTPGMTSTVQTINGNDNDMSNLRTQMVKRLSIEGPERHGEGCATVTWLDYQAPQGLGDVAGSENGVRGGERLSKFYDGIGARRGPGVHVTALGHSYGSFVTGKALTETHVPTSTVIFGSPGIGIHDTSNFSSHGRVFMEAAGFDPIARLGRFGGDPQTIPGIQFLSTGEEEINGESYQESLGHSNYLDQQSTSQYNISAISTGLDKLAVRNTYDPDDHTHPGTE